MMMTGKNSELPKLGEDFKMPHDGENSELPKLKEDFKMPKQEANAAMARLPMRSRVIE